MVACCHIGAALQTVVARNLAPSEMGVLSITKIDGGDAYNVIPERARMGGTVRAMKRETLSAIETALKRIATGVAEALGAKAEVDYRLIFAPLVNAPGPTKAIADTAAELVGEDNVDRNKGASPGIGRFCLHAREGPRGLYQPRQWRESAPVHNDRYDFNDDAIPYGAAIFARLVERTLVPEPGPT